MIFFRCTKNRNVLSKPIIQVKPHINKIYGRKSNEFLSFVLIKSKNMRHTFPIANSPLSKRSKTPRNTNATPKPAKPTPISKSKKCIYNFCQLYKKYSNFIHFDSLCVSLISNILPYYNTTERDEYIVAMQNLNFNFADKSVLIKNLRFLMTFVRQKRRNFSIVTDDERSTSKTKCQPRVR